MTRPSRYKLLLFKSIVIASCLLTLESICQVVSFMRSPQGHWRFLDPGPVERLFEAHPFLAVAPTPSTSSDEDGVQLTHNSLGLRGAEPSTLERPAMRLVAIGGSTTYCTGVSDRETWPHYLDKGLGPSTEVINMGVPGYSTAEHVIQTALGISDLQPDMAIYLVGWNDVRNMHVEDLDPYYARFHGRTQLFGLAAVREPMSDTRSALLHYLFKTLRSLAVSHRTDWIVEGAATKYTDTIDSRALSLYRRNLLSIIALCKQQTVIPVFVTQILNPKKLVSDSNYGWIPFVRDRDLIPAVTAYNEILAEVAEAEQVPLIRLDRHAPVFGDSDFLDEGHLTASGNLKLANLLVKELGDTLAIIRK